MVTEFGKLLRKLRIDKEEVLASMAKKMDVSISYLSAIENGVRAIPDDFVDKLVAKYRLNKKQKEDFIEAREMSVSKIDISLANVMPAQRQLAVMLSRKINDLDEDECEKILKIMRG